MLWLCVLIINRGMTLYKPKNKPIMKTTLNRDYQRPILRECRCTIEAGFAVSEPSGFNDLTFEGRDEE